MWLERYRTRGNQGGGCCSGRRWVGTLCGDAAAVGMRLRSRLKGGILRTSWMGHGVEERRGRWLPERFCVSPSISWWRRHRLGARRPGFSFQLCHFQPVRLHSHSFLTPQIGKMIPFLLSSQAYQNCPRVRGDERPWWVWFQAFLLKPPPFSDQQPPEGQGWPTTPLFFPFSSLCILHRGHLSCWSPWWKCSKHPHAPLLIHSDIRNMVVYRTAKIPALTELISHQEETFNR